MKCGNTGYKGRIAIVEVFPVEEKIQQLVLEKASPADILRKQKDWYDFIKARWIN